MSANPTDLSKLLFSASLVILGTLVSSVSGLLERAIIGRMLSPDGYGEFSVALAVFTLGTTLGAAGYTQGIPRFMARFDDQKDTRGAWITGLVISIGFSTVIVFILLFGSSFIVPRLFESDDASLVFSIFVIAIPIYVCFKIGIGAIRGEENTRYKVIAQNLIYPLFRIALIAGLLITGLELIATGLAYLIALVAVTILTYVFLNQLIPLRGEFTLHPREMTAFSAPLIVSTVMNVLLTRTDTIMLGYFRASSEVGIYNAAYPLAGAMAIVLGAFGYLYLPMASRLDSEEDGSVGRVYQITTKWLFLIAFPGFVTLIVFPQEILTSVFGASYAAGGTALVILTVGTFTNAAVGRNRETLSALGATNYILFSNVITFSFNFVMNLILIPRYGFTGAAVASACSYVILNGIIYSILRIQFDITPFYQKSARAYVALPLIIVPVGLIIGNSIHGSLLIIVLFGIFMSVLTVFVAAFAGVFESEDIVMIEFVEDTTNVRIPLLRRYIPDSEK